MSDGSGVPQVADRTSSGTGSTAKPAMDGIITLFSVRFCHSYYNASGGQCEGLTVEPTPDCARLMAELSIRVRNQSSGFIVYLPSSRLPAVRARIASDQGNGNSGQGCWTRLTFLLKTSNAAFIGFTGLPIDTCPTRQALFVSNLQTTGVDGQLWFGQGGAVGGSDVYPVCGPTISVHTTGDGVVSMADIGGNVVDTVACARKAKSALTLAGCPVDLYALTADPPGVYAGPGKWLYTQPDFPALGLVDLLLAQPDAGSGDPAAFPVQLSVAEAQEVELVLVFASRFTFWQYLVVVQGLRGYLSSDVSVAGSGMAFRQDFVTMPNGDRASRFSSQDPIPLSERPTQRFSLMGHRIASDGSSDSIRIDRLPTAPAAPVWPTSATDRMSGISEIFVYV
jgi:hypothetical protein